MQKNNTWRKTVRMLFGLAGLGGLVAAWLPASAALVLIEEEFDFGGAGMVAVSADYDGDGIADPALYHETSGQWHITLSSRNYIEGVIVLGGPGYRALLGDYDGDGRNDPAVYCEQTGEWAAMLSGHNYRTVTSVLGGPGYCAIPADYDGDGITDVAIYDAACGHWVVWIRVEDEITDPTALAQRFQDAVKDSRVLTARKISRDLTAIHPYNTNLVWNSGKVLVASFTRTYDYPEHVGKLYTNIFADAWVTAVPDLKNYLKHYKGTNYLLRVKQALGMPATVKNDMIAEFWVDPHLLFRPSPDPEITDREAQLDFSYTNSAYLTVSQQHVGWFENQVVANAWPWTRLGYTYDWGNSRCRVGPSEFVIPQGSVFIVHSITDVQSYLER